MLERSIIIICLGFKREISISKSCPLFSLIIINKKDKDKYKIIKIKTKETSFNPER